MKKFFQRMMVGALTLAMVAGIGLSVPTSRVEAAEGVKGKLVVIHTNDIHGYYEKTKSSLGISSVFAIRDYYEKKGANVLLLDAGDFSQGTNLVNYFKGVDAVDFLNAVGYDAVSLGNHEFDFGFDSVMAMKDKAKFPILDANILDKETGEPYFYANTIFTFDNMKVGVFGLDTPEAQTKANPKNVAAVSFLAGEELYKCAQAQVDALKGAGCDYIICLAHLGMDEESVGNRSLDVIEHVNGIDLFIDGHSHTEIPGGIKMNDTTLVSTGNYLANIGVVTVDKKETKATLVSDMKLYGECAPIDAFVATYDAIVDEAYAGKFATSEVALNGNRAPGVRTEETNLGDFAADSYKYNAQEYVGDNMTIHGAIQNGGGIRASIEAGDVSMNTLYTVFPFGNTISIVTISGAQLLEILEASCYMTPEALGGFPQVSGIEFTIDTAVEFEKGEAYPDSTYFAPAKPGSRVTIQTVGGEKFDLNATYNIAVNNFMADGGDTYYELGNAKSVVDTGIIDAEGLIAYVNSKDGVIGSEYKESKGLITIK